MYGNTLSRTIRETIGRYWRATLGTSSSTVFGALGDELFWTLLVRGGGNIRNFAGHTSRLLFRGDCRLEKTPMKELMLVVCAIRWAMG